MKKSTRTYNFITKRDARLFIECLVLDSIDFKVEFTSYKTIKVKVSTTLDVHKQLKETCDKIWMK